MPGRTTVAFVISGNQLCNAYTPVANPRAGIPGTAKAKTKAITAAARQTRVENTIMLANTVEKLLASRKMNNNT
jgi:hypothetical protein